MLTLSFLQAPGRYTTPSWHSPVQVKQHEKFIQEECKQSVGDPQNTAAAYIVELLKEEKVLQREELKLVEYISIIFDATPRKGDFFALIARCILLDPELKTARAKQTLIHCSALKGSLNAVTLASEVTTGLANRGMTNDQTVAAMNDGCYTNGAAHKEIDTVAALSNSARRFVSLCISHCASNAGDQAWSACLGYFWSLLMKIFASSETAKVRRCPFLPRVTLRSIFCNRPFGMM